MRLILARHGATHNNGEGRFTGQTDAPLSPLGQAQSAELVRALEPIALDVVMSSDLRRALATAHTISDGHGVPLEVTEDLRELNAGSWEGLTGAEARERDPSLFDAWREHPSRHAPPNGETYADAGARVHAMLSRCLSAYSEQTVLWMTHGGIIGIVLCQVLDMPLDRSWQFRRDNAAITEVRFDATRQRQPGSNRIGIITRLNDTHHLRHLGHTGNQERVQVL